MAARSCSTTRMQGRRFSSLAAIDPVADPALVAIDVYVSERTPDGSFGPAPLIAELSTPQNDQRAMVRFDGLELFLFSDRDGGSGLSDIWVSTRPTVADPWST